MTPDSNIPAEEVARDHFNEWYERQPMPQLLARVDPQQAAFNAFEEGCNYVAALNAQGDCGNAECGWRGSISECSYLGAIGPCCPKCREIVEPDGKP